MWTIKSYVLDDGADVIESWFGEYSASRFDKVRAKFLARVMYLRQQPKPPQWAGPCFHFLSGAAGIGTVNFEVRNIQYRPLGFFGPGSMEFTFLLFATEKGGKYQPTGCVDIASDRMKAVKANPNRATKSPRF